MPEKDLQTLLSSMTPLLHGETYVFCSVGERVLADLGLEPVFVFREPEGMSITLEQSVADRHSLSYTGTWSLITCQVDSDLAAIGFLAAMSRVLAESGIAVNAVSAYHHDHLFVPSGRAHEAMQALRGLSGEAASSATG